MSPYRRLCTLCGATAVLLSGLGYAQVARKLEFEVASVKSTAIDHLTFSRLMSSGQMRGGPRVYGDRAEYIYMTLRQLIAEAYDTRSFQVTGPDWLTDKRFDVHCKMPAGSQKEDFTFHAAIPLGRPF